MLGFRKFIRARLVDHPYLIALGSRGPIGVLDEVLNRKLLWSSRGSDSLKVLDGTSSISHSMMYVEICKIAVENDLYFRTFKSNLEYREVLEHCNYYEGKEYLNLLNTKSLVYKNLKKICTRDSGSPQKYYYSSLGRSSPTQIRYAKVLQDLHYLFGPLDGLKVCEIGVGYGGQAIHILHNDLVSDYVLFDLEWPGKLALKNIYKQMPGNSISPVIGDFKIEIATDLVISNYAFSELVRGVQEVYLENVIKHSRAGYVIYNHIHASPDASLSAKEFASRVPGAEIFEEIPLTFPGNVLVVWGHKVLGAESRFFKNS